ncbi:putative PurR-regulated permease PerM [Microbacteriaceae bacterium SG_E_30_P1]|uniref:PurR-regulated permease PerM n=1 Tax=Antiquaquibacter oligotrophicus TaxID=2880260 RepID=A0ABT6KK00_9MICO|nr:AI-2E family transporter [Antiquaquibacter oligotrophicus]MDH6180330.1 putative PurR-regulated permease PerM [Antiquaquibacter oligotrophicus]UDF13924.1 AI-2E family transporter [Antiquaquibacter oligotrophicus]
MIFAKRRTAEPTNESQLVPPGLAIAGAYGWRILVVLGLVAVLVFLVIEFRYIVVPFFVAILLSALLVPLVNFLRRHRWPKALAVAVAMLGTLGVVTGLVILVVAQVRSGYPDLQEKTLLAYADFTQWLSQPPLDISQDDINVWVGGVWETIQRDNGAIVNGLLSVGSTAGHVIAGVLLALFATLFILIDGRRIWTWIVRLFPQRARPAVTGAGEAGWITLTTFVKVQIFVAFVDAVGIGLGAWILGLFYGGFPLVIPIAVAVFLGAFVPVVGALLTGALAVFVALVYLGPLPAVLMLGIVLLVQQIEGHVLQPLVLGTAVKVHPLAVVFAVAAGGFTAGIAGALFAVPIVATANVMVKYIAGGTWRTVPHPTAKDILPHA